MKTSWDYSALATAYLKRPDYAPDAVNQLLSLTGVKANDPVCDVGAGVAHLTLHLLRARLNVVAVEPNDEMRKLGMERTAEFDNVRWFEGTGEQTGQSDQQFKLVTFGSSFNVTDRAMALKETSRILQSRGWFACMWNHRVLEDPIQSRIQQIIDDMVSNYDHGTRREDQTEVIDASGLFEKVNYFEGLVVHSQKVTDCVDAWKSHATLERQAKSAFPAVISAIKEYLDSLKTDEIQVPYTTRVWCAQLRK